jgi:hypothetical protein
MSAKRVSPLQFMEAAEEARGENHWPCATSSAAQDDMLKMALRYRERAGEIFVMRHSASHRWWYFPKMLPENVLLLKTYESETDGRARFLGHSAFDDPNTPPDAPTRESIEIRMMAFF